MKTKTSTVIRISKHTYAHSNTGKIAKIHDFIQEYRAAVQQYVDFIWDNPVEFSDKVFDRAHNKLGCPPFIHYKLVRFTTRLSARALCCAATQACGMIKAATEKRKKQLFVLSRLQQENKPHKKLKDKIEKYPLVKPSIPENFKPELSSKCAVLEEKKGSKLFNAWLKLKSLGDFRTTYLPIKWTKHSNRYKKLGFKRLGSFLLHEDRVDIRWEKHIPRKTEGEQLGCDPGVNDVLAFSNNMQPPKHPHGHTYKRILKRMARKQKGSKSFQRTSHFRAHFVNWAFKRLDFRKVKEVRLEDNGSLHYKNFVGRLLSHNSWSLVRDGLKGELELAGVQLTLVPCPYRSQRCSCCGWVQKRNRNRKDFLCLNCGHYDDADHNSSVNQLIDLPRITQDIIKMRLNIKGFFWQPEGFYDLEGQALFGVPGAQQGSS